MSNQYIQLKNPSGDLLYPRTDWSVILNRPSFATVAQLNTKQDQLTAANSGPGITIDTVEGVLRISATAVSNYQLLTNKPSINGVELSGALTSQDLNLVVIDTDGTSIDGILEFADNAGNVIMRLTDGHIVTKNFDSSVVSDATKAYLIQAGYVTSDYHDSTKQDINTFADTARDNKLSQWSWDWNTNTWALLGTMNPSTGVNDYTTPILTITNGLLKFGNSLVLTEGSITGINVSTFVNDCNYITDDDLQDAIDDLEAIIATKQNTLIAGANITLIPSGNSVIISAIGSGGTGTGDYTDLLNKPSINGHILMPGDNTLTSLGIVSIVDDSSGIDGIFEIADQDGNVIMRLENGGVVTQTFSSDAVITSIATINSQLSNFVTRSYLTSEGTAYNSTKWGGYAYPGVGSGLPDYIMGIADLGTVGSTPLYYQRSAALHTLTTTEYGTDLPTTGNYTEGSIFYKIEDPVEDWYGTLLATQWSPTGGNS